MGCPRRVSSRATVLRGSCLCGWEEIGLAGQRARVGVTVPAAGGRGAAVPPAWEPRGILHADKGQRFPARLEMLSGDLWGWQSWGTPPTLR